ncbi:MAG: EF-hand domain-containing protein [Planctomycetia bacterium]|nr:EF-hand domain-containing protein [Planctomycetia bacterium]
MRSPALARLPLVAALLAVGTLASPSSAAPGKQPDPQKIFAKKDANSDGSLTLEEFKAGMKDKQLEHADRRFKKSDTNGDGKLSFDEFKAALPKPKE